MLAALGFLVTIAYWPGISGAATSPRWIVMAGAAVMMLMASPTRITLAHLAGGLFVAWALFTFTWSLSPDDTVGMGLHLVLLGMVFCLASMKEDLRSVYIGVALGLVPSGFIAIVQWFGWDGLPQTASPSGFFVNRNFYAEVCALVAVALISERLWLYLPTTLPGLVLTNARGALLAFIVPIVFLIWRQSTYRPKLFAIWCILLFAEEIIRLTVLKGWTPLVERYAYWDVTFASLTWFGDGLGSFFVAAPHPLKQYLLFEHPHNEFLEIAFELGWIGLALFGLFILTLFRSTRSTESLVLIALMVESCFEFPLHQPVTAFVSCCAAGCVAGRLRWSVREAWARGAPVRPGSVFDLP